MRSRPRSLLPPTAENAPVLPSAVPLVAGGAVWSEAFVGAPGSWAALVAIAILVTALAIHLAYVLADRRGAPAKLTEALKYAIDAGNYQEAWEICGRGRRAFLARILQPALERIGEGRPPVEEAIDRRFRHEQKFLAFLLWGFLGGGVALPLLCLLAAGIGGAPPVPDVHGRAVTLAAGNLALFAAAVFAVIATSAVLWFGFRARAARQFPFFREEAERFVRNLAYEDLEGLRIGQDFDAGSIQGTDPRPAATGRLRVSRELTTACPHCNAPINPSRNPCPYCGSPFEWS